GLCETRRGALEAGTPVRAPAGGQAVPGGGAGEAGAGCGPDRAADRAAPVAREGVPREIRGAARRAGTARGDDLSRAGAVPGSDAPGRGPALFSGGAGAQDGADAPDPRAPELSGVSDRR